MLGITFDGYFRPLLPCCHIAATLQNAFLQSSFERSVAAWQQNYEKKIFFQFTARAIINGTLFRNKERLFSNKARLLFNNPGLFGNTLGVILFPFGEKYFPSGENIFSPAGIFIFCRWNSRLTTAKLNHSLLYNSSNDWPSSLIQCVQPLQLRPEQ